MLTVSRSRCPIAAILLALMAGPVSATVLTFDVDGIFAGITVDPTYGDRVSAPSDAAGTYAIGAEGATPNVVVDYLGAVPSVHTFGYSDLTNVFYNERESGDPVGLVLSADPGFDVTLESVDVGNFGVGVTLASIRVLDGAGTELFRQEDIALANSSQPALALSFGAGLTADLLRFEIDLAMLGARSDNVGIDNVRFSQIPRAPVSGVIPLPAGLPLLLGGLVPSGCCFAGLPARRYVMRSARGLRARIGAGAMAGISEATRRTGIFAGEDPYAIARGWLAEAVNAEPKDANAAALATVDKTGLPNVRLVLLKEIEANQLRGGFVFFTNFESAKGRELEASAKAAMVLHWKSLDRQLRLRGLVERIPDKQADEYYHTRAYQSRIGAWASKQSRPLSSRRALLAEVAKLAAKYPTKPPRPPHWGGYRIRPVEIEFWAQGDFRLHDRFRWTRMKPDSDAWTVQRLSP